MKGECMDNAMKIEADKVRLIRAIVEIDNEAILKKVKQQLFGILNIAEEDSDEYITKGIRESLHEYKKVKSGKSKSRPVEELLNEL